MINYIIKTLQKGENAVINGLGDFTISLKHATTDKKMFYPPFYEVIFSQNLDLANNYSLADTISFEKKCMFTEANEEITAWKDELLAALENNKSINFENFGTFMLDKKGNISFQCDFIPELNKRFDSFEAIDIKQLFNEVPASDDFDDLPTKETIEQTSEKTTLSDNNTVIEPIAQIEESNLETTPDTSSQKEFDAEMEVCETDNISEAELTTTNNNLETKTLSDIEVPVEEYNNDTTEEKEDENKEDIAIKEEEYDDDIDNNNDDNKHHKSHKFAWLWILLLLFIVLGVLCFIFKDKLILQFEKIRNIKQNTEQIEPTISEDNIIENSIILEAETQETESESIEEVEEINKEVEPVILKQTQDGKYNYIKFEKGYFYAIAGSFYTEKDIENHIKQKSLDKYNPTIVVQDGLKNLRVCIGIFNNEDEAETFAKSVNKQYWVLK